MPAGPDVYVCVPQLADPDILVALESIGVPVSAVVHVTGSEDIRTRISADRGADPPAVAVQQEVSECAGFVRYSGHGGCDEGCCPQHPGR